jgi:HPr kinase/phosphorylase
MAILVETAVRKHMLRLKGYDAGEDFIERQRAAIEAEPDA